MAVVEASINANAPAAQVFDDLRAAETQARKASDKDPAWIPLAGGISALRIGLDDNAAEAARTGIAVMRTECARSELAP